jgi:hypothetical protein
MNSNFVLHYVRYIQMFWQDFYQSPKENEELDLLVWQKAATQLTWHNQLDLADFYDKHFNHVECKASAWFYVTYEEELHNNEIVVQQSDRLYSFAWLVYPVLLHIYDRCRDDSETSFVIRRTKRKKKNRRRRRKRQKD